MTSIAAIQGIKAVVLDIEGTVCPITFVKDTLYPYALKKLQQVLSQTEFPLQPQKSALAAALAAFPVESQNSPTQLYEHALDLTTRDIKAPYWKNLQGLLWESGYASGEIKASLYRDAVAALIRWAPALRSVGGGVYIYSSGSVSAQKLVFGHVTDSPDLNVLLDGYFDTVNAGPKTEASSYTLIANEINTPTDSILFFSDNPKEIAAAHEAGWHTVFTVREGNPVGLSDYQQPEIATTSFESL